MLNLIIHTIFAAVTLQSVNLSNIKSLPIVSAVELTDYLGDDGLFIYSMIKICGIYKITSPTGKIYIGQAVDIDIRWRDYKNMKCKRQLKLYNSFKKHGVENHKFEIVEECLREQLNEREKYYVDLFKTFNTEHGMNLRDGGGNNGIFSDESRRRISKSKEGSKLSAETKMKLSELRKGKRLSEETKRKIGEKSKGRKHTEEAKRKMSLVQKNRPKISEETRKRMSEAHKGRVVSEETRKKMSEVRKGRKQSPELIYKRIKARMETLAKRKAK